jgi:cyanophycinase
MRFVAVLGIVCLVANAALAETKYPPRLTAEDMAGAVLLLPQGKTLADAHAPFVRLAEGEDAMLVVVGEEQAAFKPFPVKSLTTFASTSDADFKAALATASGVWLASDEALSEETLVALRQARDRGAVIAARAPVLDALSDGLTLEVPPPAGQVGLSYTDDALVIIEGRTIRNRGDGEVKLYLAASPSREARVITVERREPMDLHELRRAAWQRANEPGRPIGVPEVKSGALVIVGGGLLPQEVIERFIKLGGGAEGRFVILPTAQDPVPPGDAGAFLKRFGAQHVDVVTARKQAELETPETLALFERATGVWFGGGRQWRFIDAYEGTKVLPALHQVLARGGVIGGSSAGATIQGDYLVRGAPAGPRIMMSEGYERGFNFLPGTAIDQHFTQRKRFPDMTALMKAYPQYLGIGIDEATALIVQGSTAEIIGNGQVHFYDRRREVVEGQPDYETLSAGQRYNLQSRQKIADTP